MSKFTACVTVRYPIFASSADVINFLFVHSVIFVVANTGLAQETTLWSSAFTSAILVSSESITAPALVTFAVSVTSAFSSMFHRFTLACEASSKSDRLLPISSDQDNQLALPHCIPIVYSTNSAFTVHDVAVAVDCINHRHKNVASFNAGFNTKSSSLDHAFVRTILA